MGDQTASRFTRRVFHMQHFVKQDILHYQPRDPRTVQATIQNNLIGPGIVTTKLSPPDSAAPTHSRLCQRPFKKARVQFSKYLGKVKVPSARVNRSRTNPMTSNLMDAPAGPVRSGVFGVSRSHAGWSIPPVKSRQQQSRRTFQHFAGCATKQI